MLNEKEHNRRNSYSMISKCFKRFSAKDQFLTEWDICKIV
jgi:hypothetical protein